MSDTKGHHYLTGKLLLAMPQMGDPRFEKSVIFICAHDENGAMGLVVNNQIHDLKFADLLGQLKITSDIHIDLDALSIPVMSGGPVDVSRGFLLHSTEFKQDDTMEIGKEFSVTGTVDALKEIAVGNGPQSKLFALGYAGWEAGQLEQEIQNNTWLITDPDPAIIYNETPDKKWDMAVATLGFDPTMISGQAGRA